MMKVSPKIWSLLLLLIFLGCNHSQQSPENTTDNQLSNTPDRVEDLQLDRERSASSNTAGNAKEYPDQITNHRRNAITNAVENVSPSIVSISVTELVKQKRTWDPWFDGFFIPGRVQEFNSLGTGFIVSDDGYVITNQHVIGNNPSKIVITLSDGHDYQAEIVGMDEYGDLALLKMDVNNLVYVTFGNSDETIVGEWAIALGNPFGLFDDGQPSVTVGVISATKRDFRPNPQEPRVYMDMIQTDAAINRGNSGGPLVNSLGEVIGVNTFIYTGGTSSGFVGLGFAIPSNTVSKIIKQLKETGSVTLGYDLGMEIKPITVERAYKYNLPLMQGVFVISVNESGPSYKSGILPGDVLIEFNGVRIYSFTHYQALLREHNPGETIDVVILRRGNLYKTTVELMPKS